MMYIINTYSEIWTQCAIGIYPHPSGWCFGTMDFYDFPYGNFIIPTDELEKIVAMIFLSYMVCRHPLVVIDITIVIIGSIYH